MSDNDTSSTPLAERMLRQAGVSPERARSALTIAAASDEARVPDGPLGVQAVWRHLTGHERLTRGTPVRLDRRRRGASGEQVRSRESLPDRHQVSLECGLQAALATCAALTDAVRADPPISVYHLFLRAAVTALRAAPGLVAGSGDETIRRLEFVNLGLVIATEDAVVIPVIIGVQSMGLTELARCSDLMIRRAWDGTLSDAEGREATFTVSQPSSAGVSFQPVVPAFPTLKRPVHLVFDAPFEPDLEVANGSNAGDTARPRRAKIRLSFAPEAADAATGTTYLRALRQLIEEPRRLLL